jgi:hypothetical protein
MNSLMNKGKKIFAQNDSISNRLKYKSCEICNIFALLTLAVVVFIHMTHPLRTDFLKAGGKLLNIVVVGKSSFILIPSIFATLTARQVPMNEGRRLKLRKDATKKGRKRKLQIYKIYHNMFAFLTMM